MIYQVQDPQGKVHEIEGPDNASPEEITKQAQALVPSQSPQVQEQPNAMTSSTPYQDIWNQPNKGIGAKAWESLAVPAQTASKVLGAVANQVPEGQVTGNMAADLARGTPRILANTVAQAAPGFVSRSSMLTAGAAKALQALRPIGSAVGQGIAGQLESATGSNPGSLGRAWNDPSLIFGAGKKAAGPLYEAGKAEMQGANIFKDMYKPDEIVSTAKDYLSKGGKLEPAEALTYRKALDILGRSRNVVKDGLVAMRQGANEAVKASENMSQADAAFQRGLDSESLRKLVPSNKYGGASAFKMGIMGLLGPNYAGLLSPVVHGTLATAGGMAARVATNPLAAVTGRELITQFVEHRIHEDNQ